MAKRGAISVVIHVLHILVSFLSIFISPCFCFFSLSIQSLPITQVCTISKETKRKFNPVTKCEKVREVPCQALETGTETFKRNETNKIYCFFQIPQELCGPSGCGFVQGPEICHDEVFNFSDVFLKIKILISRRRPL